MVIDIDAYCNSI